MCDGIGFIPDLGKMKLPEGYALEGVTDMGGETCYYWIMQPDEHDSETWRFGRNAANRRAAVRQAWRDFRSGGTDPDVIDGLPLPLPYR